MIPKYDRLNGIDTDEITFDFICPECKNDGLKDPSLFEIHVIGVATKPDTLDNSDLPKEIQLQYNKLPTIRQAILRDKKDAEGQTIVINCKHCGQINIGNVNFNKNKLRKWVDKHYPEVLIL